MAYSVDWPTKVILIPKTDLILITASPEVYELDVLKFWEAIHAIQESEGITYDTIMKSGAPTSFGPRGVEIINDYLIEFEDGQYTIRLTNANSDIISNLVPNQVSIRDQTVIGASTSEIVDAILAAGGTGGGSGGGLTTDQDKRLTRIDLVTQTINSNNP